MRELRLFDPERRPPNWMGHVREGEYALFFKDSTSGQEMKADGTYVRSPEESTCLIAASIDDALDFAQARVDASPSGNPRLRCDIYDWHGKSNPPLASLVPQGNKTQENTEAMGWKRIRWGLLLVPVGIPLILYDWHKDWALIYPAFFGIQFIAAGIRMLVWGMGTLENSRRSAAFIRSRLRQSGANR